MTLSYRSATLVSVAAAVFPKELRHGLERGEVRGVDGQAAFSARLDQCARHEPIEMMVERRPGDLQLLLELGRRHALWACLDDGPQDGEPGGMSESPELSRVAFEYAHTSINLDV